MSQIEPLPGFREFYPDDCSLRNAIMNVWRRVCRAHNFVEYSVPTLQPTELFIEKSGPEIVGQLFNFTDKGEREITLPPEATPYVAMMVGKKAAALKRPIKWFSIPECFRYERPQKGRTRSFYQLNADIFDDDTTNAELSLILVTIDIFRAFGLTNAEFAVRLSDRTLWLAFLKAIDLSEDQSMEVLRVVDKWEREAPEEIEKKLAAIVGAEDAPTLKLRVGSMLKLTSLEAVEDFFKNQLGGIAEEKTAAIYERLESWKKLLGDLDAAGVGDYVRVDLGIVRGLAYYTGFVYEVFETKRPSRALAGGGRYDKLVEKMGGPSMPAMGMGLGDVTLIDLLRDEGKLPNFISGVDFYFVHTSDTTRAKALGLAEAVRQAGFTAEISPKPNAIGKQLKAATKAGAAKAVIIGDEELDKGIVKLKCLNGGDEREVPAESLVEHLKGA